MVSVNNISHVDNRKSTTKTIAAASSSGSSFESYLGESMSMDKIFDKAAAKYNVPVELLKAIGKAESGFDAKAVSRSGAQGVMQLMPATAKELGVTNSFDPEQNIMGGSKYIAGLLKKYNGDVKLALAAYNAGSGNVAKYGGIPPFKETQNYVKKVMGYMKGTDNSGAEEYATNTENTVNNTDANVDTKVNVNDNAKTVEVVAAEVWNEAAEINLLLDGSLSSIDHIFTYDDYLRFIEKLVEKQNEEETEDQSKLYAAQQINYNIPVMNLLTNNIT